MVMGSWHLVAHAHSIRHDSTVAIFLVQNPQDALFRDALHAQSLMQVTVEGKVEVVVECAEGRLQARKKLKKVRGVDSETAVG
jgi:hypothetical protein